MNETIKTKICGKCKNEQPITLFYNDKGRKDGLYPNCKTCHKKVQQNYYLNNKDKFSDYYISNKDNINAKRKQLRIINKYVISERRKKYLIKNREKILKLQKTYYFKNRESLLMQKKEYYELNIDKIQKYGKKYRQTIGFKISTKNSNHIRRSQKKIGDVKTLQLIELQQNAKVCYWCKCSLKSVKVHIDHYTPLSKGGLHTLSNLVVSCQSCNNKKHAKDPLEFANSIGRLL